MSAKKWLGFGLRFVPFVSQVINAVEAVKDAKGPEKLAKVNEAVLTGIQAVEFSADRDLLNDVKVQQAQTKFIEAYVELQNAIAAAKEGIEAAKASRVSGSDGTGEP